MNDNTRFKNTRNGSSIYCPKNAKNLVLLIFSIRVLKNGDVVQKVFVKRIIEVTATIKPEFISFQTKRREKPYKLHNKSPRDKKPKQKVQPLSNALSALFIIV